ncbi:MAG: hypothetical protein HOM14_05345 [Gammaproteobacteria bacterium]|jgi:heterotetrameric sarcosine oxidase gamma subunit|nr:hypothetical protein [Gammaproteobacteria bacterium]MBT3723603.1 hypothetical protein [Gammaproteobacteria bacterium]MBT4077138.1 hypothetical protein [Gammaproteobacteria bacterium]MBT4194028.1 hypothetical protein [Gammaproteobacteria bacterium]MBT4449991.1 hypothetical protein [Gammaproteobacteria bacterium]
MPEIRSPLAMNEHARLREHENYQSHTGYQLSEYAPGLLIQLAGWDDFDEAAKPTLKSIGLDGLGDYGTVQLSNDVSCFRIAPEKILLRVDQKSFSYIFENADMESTPLIDLSHARWIIAVQGEQVEDLMSQLAALDFSMTTFPVGNFKQSGIHQIAVLIHRVAVDRFEIIVPLNWTVSLWELICELAKPSGYEIKEH